MQFGGISTTKFQVLPTLAEPNTFESNHQKKKKK